MKIGRRLILSYALILAFLAAVLLVSANRLDHLSQVTGQVVGGDAARAILAGEINLHAESAASRLLLLFILEDRDQRVAVYKEIDNHSRAIDSTIATLKPLLASDNELAALVSLRSAYDAEFTRTVEELEGGDRASATRRMSGGTREALKRLLAETDKLAKQQQASMMMRQVDALKTAAQSKLLVISLGFAALLAGVLMAVVITRGISRPLSGAVTSAELIAGGDLSSAVPVGSADEVGQLLGSMGHMRTRLRDVIGGIQQSATQVGNAASHLIGPSGKVKTESGNQLHLAGQIEKSVGVLTAGIGEMVAGAEATRVRAESARDMAQDGAKAIVVAADEIARIAVSVSHSAEAVAQLDQSAKEVATTVSVIKEIADQTNLLALNASIEAARAGETGRGFAVVADEVRKLANRTAEATVEITKVIAAINSQTAIASHDIHAGRTGMDHGMEIIRAIVAPLGELRDGAQASLESLEGLTRVAQAQAAESAAIAENVGQIVAIATANNAAAESVVAITDDLGKLSDTLQTSIAAFRL